MRRDEHIRQLQVGLIRSFNTGEILNMENDGYKPSDDDLVGMFGESARPLAEALYDMLADFVAEGPRPG
jgi:hypothetical protein